VASRVVLRKAVVKAAHAASVANSQPWHFELDDNRIDIFADWSRQLPNFDPSGRQLAMSVGCAIFNARASLAAEGKGATVALVPDPLRSDLFASIETRPGAPVETIGNLVAEVERRMPASSDFVASEVPEFVRPIISACGEAEGAAITWVESAEQMTLLDELARQAAQIQQIERGNASQTSTPFPYKDSWTAMTDAPVGSVFVLSVEDDTKTGWLRAGQALQRALLELTAQGFLALPQAGPIEVPFQRSAVRRLLELDGQPVLALVAGTGSSRPTLRRRLVEVLTEH
jgi:hypothetical protein